MTANCSLVIRKISVDDVGRYTCRQFIKSEIPVQQGPDALVLLSVINSEYLHHNVFKLSYQKYILKHYDYVRKLILLLFSFSPSSPVIEEKMNDIVTLSCAVLTYRGCGHTVKWLYEGNKSDVEILQPSCSARVTFTALNLNQKSKYFESLKCNVTDKKSGETLLCNAGPQSSCEKTGMFGLISCFQVTLMFRIQSLRMVNMKYFITISCVLLFHIIFHKNKEEAHQREKTVHHLQTVKQNKVLT